MSLHIFLAVDDVNALRRILYAAAAEVVDVTVGLLCGNVMDTESSLVVILTNKLDVEPALIYEADAGAYALARIETLVSEVVNCKVGLVVV